MTVSIGNFVRKARNQIIRAADVNDLQIALEQLDGTLTGTEATTITAATAPLIAITNPGEIVEGDDSGNAVSTRHRAHRCITVAASDAPGWIKRIADYVCDGVADEVEIQAAIDEAQTYVGSSTRGTNVELSPGVFNLSSGITKKTAAIVGMSKSSNAGTRVNWTGADLTGVAITQSTDIGGGSWGGIENISFRNGSTQGPEIWLDLTAVTVDVMFQLDRCHFAGGGTQIKGSSWINLHWTHLRFDGWHEYCIEMTPDVTQNLSTFVLDQWTADHQTTSSPGKGFIHIDNTVNASNLGTVHVSNGRFEVNELMSSPNAFFVYTVGSGGSANPRTLALHLDDITIAASSGDAIGSIIYRDSANTSAGEYFLIENLRCNNVTAYLGGTWASNFPTPAGTPSNIARIAAGLNTNLSLSQTQGHVGNATSQSIIQSSVLTDTQQRYILQADGSQTYGSGSSTGDTTWGRTAVGTMGVAADDAIRTGRGATGSRPSASTVGAGATWFDTTLGKPIWSTGSAWVDATGTTV